MFFGDIRDVAGYDGGDNLPHCVEELLRSMALRRDVRKGFLVWRDGRTE